MGPFYCPNDKKIYLDTSFFQEIETRFRGCEAEHASLAGLWIAHEVGHHVQNLQGILTRANSAQQAAGGRTPEANRIQVRVELQADCLAGIWANKSDERCICCSPVMSRPRYALPRRSATTRYSGARRAEWCRQLHPWHLRATPALVQHRPEAGNGRQLQHVRADGAALSH